jgi:hypothetical protein
MAAVTRYEAALDDLYLNPNLPLDSFHAVAVTPDFSTETSAVAQFREKDYRQQGRISVVEATVVKSSPTGDGIAPPRVQVEACTDVSQIRGTDVNGASIVAPDRKPFLVALMTFVPMDDSGSRVWKVSEVTNKEAASCAG